MIPLPLIMAGVGALTETLPLLFAKKPEYDFGRRMREIETRYENAKRQVEQDAAHKFDFSTAMAMQKAGMANAVSGVANPSGPAALIYAQGAANRDSYTEARKFALEQQKQGVLNTMQEAELKADMLWEQSKPTVAQGIAGAIRGGISGYMLGQMLEPEPGPMQGGAPVNEGYKERASKKAINFLSQHGVNVPSLEDYFKPKPKNTLLGDVNLGDTNDSILKKVLRPDYFYPSIDPNANFEPKLLMYKYGNIFNTLNFK